MIDHTKCDHPRTSGARAKCRRANSAGDGTKRVKMGATPKEPGSSRDRDDNYGQTPGRKEDECHVCGVERMQYSGTDRFTSLLVYVGEKCYWRISDSADRRPLRP